MGGYQSFFLGYTHRHTIDQIKELVQNCYVYLKVIENTLGFDRFSNKSVQLNENVNKLNKYIKQ
jgi:F0F1-type ATP synthase beta subunit